MMVIKCCITGIFNYYFKEYIIMAIFKKQEDILVTPRKLNLSLICMASEIDINIDFGTDEFSNVLNIRNTKLIRRMV